MSDSEIGWELQRPLARLIDRGLSAQVDVSRPQLGLHELRLHAAVAQGSLLSTSIMSADDPAQPAKWPMPLADAYVRGGDLVAAYGSTPQWPYAPQIYWRSGRPDAGGAKSADDALWSRLFAAVSVIVSIQTDLLDTYPQIEVTTCLAADEMLQLNGSEVRNAQSGQPDGSDRGSAFPACLLWRLRGGKLSYAEIVSQSDYRRVAVRHGAKELCSSHWELFAEFLEKGVIRRARVTGVLLPRENDLKLATECCRASESWRLPLTT